jgi:hypothetical protein
VKSGDSCPGSSGKCSDLRTEEGGCWKEIDTGRFRQWRCKPWLVELMI